MKDLLEQSKVLKKKFISSQLVESDPLVSQNDDEEKPPEPQKLKIDIPDSPFEVDVQQIKGKLKNILKAWETKEYPSDEVRWKMYFKDILNLYNKIEGDEDEV